MTINRLFLDANVLFSVAYGSLGLRRFWVLQNQQRCELFTSRYAIEEARRNLESPRHLNLLNEYVAQLNIVPETDPNIPCPVDLPKKDIPILMAAIQARCDYLITGDRTHFGRYFDRTIMGVKICTPSAYLESLSP